MQEKILHTAIEEFLNFGFKSVTMDDIAEKMAISKKTIYAFYKNKTALVEATVMAVFDKISFGIDHICSLEKNAIEELFNVKEFLIENLKSEKSSPLYQLKKYYSKIFYELQKKQFEVMKDCVQENLNRGVLNGYYRTNIDIDLISRIYFMGTNMIKDIDVFPKGKHNMKGLMTDYLEYHIRAIATKKGIEILENRLKNDN